MLKIERMEQGTVTVLRLTGDLDNLDANELRQAILTCLQDQRCRLVVNFSSVIVLGRMGVGAIMDYLGRLRSLNGDIKLACLNLQSKRLLGLMGLGHVFEMYEVESAAVQGYKQVAA